MTYTKDDQMPLQQFHEPSSSLSEPMLNGEEHHHPDAEPVDFGHTERYFPQGGEEAPPDFTVYEAEYTRHDDGNIVSHDPHLNEDGEALYRFLLSKARTPPTYHLHCRGYHQERRYRDVQRQRNGETVWERESYYETVTDFDFYIDATSSIILGPIHWSVADNEPAFRGKMVREMDEPQGRRKALRQENKADEEWRHRRSAQGLPPWLGPTWNDQDPFSFSMDARNVQRSSKTLRQWADDYCQSSVYLKEFYYEKVVYGWDTASLVKAVRACIFSSGYRGTVEVGFNLLESKIKIRPDNAFSRTLSHAWVRVILWISLIYPFIWLFKRFSSRGGGRWEVCGGAYAVKYWEPQPPFPGSSQGSGWRVMGTREGEWFRMWEGIIRNSVASRLKSNDPIKDPSGIPREVAALDGYIPDYAL